VSDDADLDCAPVGDTGFRAAAFSFGFLGLAAACLGATTSMLGSAVGALPGAGASAVCARTAAFEPSSSDIELESRRMPLREYVMSWSQDALPDVVLDEAGELSACRRCDGPIPIHSHARTGRDVGRPAGIIQRSMSGEGRSA
jgi:hypothetical protein